MTDRIDEIEEQAKVILDCCRQQRLPEEHRDILEYREIGDPHWVVVFEGGKPRFKLRSDSTVLTEPQE